MRYLTRLLVAISPILPRRGSLLSSSESDFLLLFLSSSPFFPPSKTVPREFFQTVQMMLSVSWVCSSCLILTGVGLDDVSPHWAEIDWTVPGCSVEFPPQQVRRRDLGSGQDRRQTWRQNCLDFALFSLLLQGNVTQLCWLGPGGVVWEKIRVMTGGLTDQLFLLKILL